MSLAPFFVMGFTSHMIYPKGIIKLLSRWASEGKDPLGDGRSYHHGCAFHLQHNHRKTTPKLSKSSTFYLQPENAILGR